MTAAVGKDYFAHGLATELAKMQNQQVGTTVTKDARLLERDGESL